MEFPIQQIPMDAYAGLQARFGAKIVRHKGRHWRRVRPFFYRPLLPVEAIGETGPWSPVPWPCGFQHVVPAGAPANSTMNFVMLESPQDYSLGGLNHKRRQLIKRAAQQFEVRPIVDPLEMKARGHGVYLSFYERTKYPYRSDRREKAVFDAWVDAIFHTPGTILMGGYGQDGLAAISMSYWVNSTLIYSTLLCGTAAMHRNLGELMFHEIRQLAARHPGIREIFVRPYQGGSSMDQYYLLRGCTLARQPARLEIPTLNRALIRWLAPEKYEILCGDD